jgi:hypothetical protein
MSYLFLRLNLKNRITTILILISLMLASCAGSKAHFNPNSLPENQLAKITDHFSWPSNHLIINVDGEYPHPLVDRFSFIAPGKRQISWVRLDLGDQAENGSSTVVFKAGIEYKIGIRDKSIGIEIWEKHSGKSVKILRPYVSK